MSAVLPVSEGLPLPWRRALPVLLLLLLSIGLLYRETATVMVGVWSNSETFTHAFLVPPMSLWLVWRQRALLARLSPQPMWWALLPMAAVALVWLAADLMVVNALTQFAFVALLLLAVLLVLGWQVVRAILFPLMFLFFAVPFGDFLLPVLMESTADFTVAAVRMSGIPVYREGQQFVIPSGTWSVVEACSGVRYLIASLMVGTLFAYLNYNTLWKRWIFVGVSIVVPIVANWLRAYMIVMLGHLSNNKIAVGVDHLIYGWVFFGIVIMLMFTIGARWAEPEVAPGDVAVAATSGATTRVLWQAGLVGLLVAAAAQAGVWALERRERSAAAPQLTLPQNLAPTWRGVAPGATPLDWAPQLQNPRAALHRSYEGAAGSVGVHIAYFRGQGYDSKLVNSMHSPVKADDSTWNRHSRPDLAVAAGNERAPLSMSALQTGPTLSNSRLPTILVGQTYWVDGRFTASALEAKLLGALSRLRGRGDDGALVMLYAVDLDEQRARARLEQFAAVGLPVMAETFKAVQAAR